MFLMRYSGDADYGVQIETHLFVTLDAARAYMKADFEKERDSCAKLGIPYPRTTSEEDEENYTDISEDEIRVYQDGETMMHWEVIELTPEDLPESLKKKPEENEMFLIDIFSATADGETSILLHDPDLTADEDEIGECLAENLDLDDPDDMEMSQATIWLPETLISKIQVDAIRKFLAGTFKIKPVGYGIFLREGIAEEIEACVSEGLFESDEDAVQQAIRDGIKLIPVKELPKNFECQYLGWIDTPKNRQMIANYCKRKLVGRKGAEQPACLCRTCAYAGDKFSFPLPNDKIIEDEEHPGVKHIYCCCGDCPNYGKDLTFLGVEQCEHHEKN